MQQNPINEETEAKADLLRKEGRGSKDDPNSD